MNREEEFLFIQEVLANKSYAQRKHKEMRGRWLHGQNNEEQIEEEPIKWSAKMLAIMDENKKNALQNHLNNNDMIMRESLVCGGYEKDEIQSTMAMAKLVPDCNKCIVPRNSNVYAIETDASAAYRA